MTESEKSQIKAEFLKKYNVVTTKHFYHYKKENRNVVTEALILNCPPPNVEVAIKIAKQMSLTFGY